MGVHKAVSTTGMSVNQAVLNLQAGRLERESLGLLYQEFYGPVFGVVYRKCEDRELTKDIVQDTFVIAHERINRFDPDKGAFSTWVCTIAVNLLRKHWRQEEKEQKCLAEFARVCPSSSPGQDELREDLLDYEEAWQTLRSLPVHEFATMHMHIGEKMTYKEMSEELRLPVRTLKYYNESGVKRAQKAFHAAMTRRRLASLAPRHRNLKDKQD